MVLGGGAALVRRRARSTGGARWVLPAHKGGGHDLGVLATQKWGGHNLVRGLLVLESLRHSFLGVCHVPSEQGAQPSRAMGN